MGTYRGDGTPGAGDDFPTAEDIAAAVTAAELAETNAAASEAAASTSAGNAATSETNAASSASAASTSETNAAASASAAATSETNAGTSETNAATSETNAATSEANAAQSYDDFDDRYLGAKASDPALDNDGNALLTGALYWKTSATVGMRAYNGSAWEDVNQDSYLKAETYSQAEVDANTYTQAQADAAFQPIETEEAWIAPTLLNSWVFFGSPYRPPGYRKSANGDIHVRFMVKNGTSATSSVFTLPSGYRPSHTTIFTGINGTTANVVRFDISATGTVGAVAGGSTTWQALECVFRP